MKIKSPTTPVTSVPLSEEEKAYLKDREDIIVAGLKTRQKTTVEAAKALYEVFNYKGPNGRKLWRDSESFVDFCHIKYGYEHSQVYRHRNTGEFLSCTGINVQPANPRQVQELITDENKLPIVPVERRVECWNWIVAEAQKLEGAAFNIEKLKGVTCDDLVWKFLVTNGLADAARLAARKAKRERGKIAKALMVLKDFAAAPGQELSPRLPDELSALETKLSRLEKSPEAFAMTEAQAAQARAALDELKKQKLVAEIQIQEFIQSLEDHVHSSHTSWFYRGAAVPLRVLQQACAPACMRVELVALVESIDGLIQDQLNR